MSRCFLKVDVANLQMVTTPKWLRLGGDLGIYYRKSGGIDYFFVEIEQYLKGMPSFVSCTSNVT